MNRRFEGATVLVTAGASGLGRASVLRFAQEGAARVAVVDKSEPGLAAIAAECEALGAEVVGVQADLSDADRCVDAVREAVARGGPPAIVVSNAGISSGGPILELELEAWARVMQVNVTAGFLVGREAARAMVAAGTKGVILYTASIAGHGGVPRVADYSVSKAALIALVRTMALELAPSGIRVVSVSPGWMDTPGTAALEGEEAMATYRMEGFPHAPLRRLARPEEVAGLFAFLASDDGAFITGTDVTIDGGMTAPAFPMPASLR